MRKNLTRALLAALTLLIAAPAYADGPGDAGPNVAAPPVRAQPLPPPQSQPSTPAATPTGRSGVITLNGDELTLSVPTSYRFYPAEEAYAFMQRNNATAPAGTVLGLLAPASADIRAPGTWATVISYDAIGYVQPETAAGLDTPNFETQVSEARASQNRPFEGFALQPEFNAETAPRLAWAERTAAPGGGQGKDFRFEQKVLGRYGVAGMTSIGAADQMPAIQAAAPEQLAMLQFPEGRRHGDFQAASDTVSSYSVPGLVTGVAALPETLAISSSTDGQGQTGFGGLAGWFPWIALGVIVLAITGYMLTRRREDDDLEDPEDA